MMQNNAFYCLKWLPAGSLPTTCRDAGYVGHGPTIAFLRKIPAISMAVCIIPNSCQMFNDIRTVLAKKLTADFTPLEKDNEHF